MLMASCMSAVLLKKHILLLRDLVLLGNCYRCLAVKYVLALLCFFVCFGDYIFLLNTF